MKNGASYQTTTLREKSYAYIKKFSHEKDASEKHICKIYDIWSRRRVVELLKYIFLRSTKYIRKNRAI